MTLEATVRQRLLTRFLELDSSGNFVNPPRTDNELHSFISVAYGISIPRKVIIPGHSSPFQFVADLFFERVTTALGFANRSGGKTFNVAILNHLDMMFKRRCEIASAGAVKEQADRCYRYFRKFCQLKWFTDLSKRYFEIAGKPFYEDKDSIKARTLFGNEALLEVLTGSEKGLRSPHPNKFRFDEVDLIPWDILQTALSMSSSSNGILGQDVFTSTRQKDTGSMQVLLDTAEERGIRVYEWNIWETLEQCDRRCKNDPVHGDCPVYTFCKGRAHYCEGFYKIVDFIKKVKLLDRVTFETEWENKFSRQQSLVYWMIDSRHIMTPEKLYALCNFPAPQPTWHRISGLDFGSSPGHPFVYLKFFQIPVGHHPWLLFYEYVAEQDLLRNHAMAIKTSPYYFPGEIIYADWDAQDRLELQAHHIKTRAAIKGPGSVNVGIDYICSLLSGFPPNETPILYFWHTCQATLKELRKYSWPLHPDGKPDRTGNPIKAFDNSSDAMRMALYSYKRVGSARYSQRMIRI